MTNRKVQWLMPAHCDCVSSLRLHHHCIIPHQPNLWLDLIGWKGHMFCCPTFATLESCNSTATVMQKWTHQSYFSFDNRCPIKNSRINFFLRSFLSEKSNKILIGLTQKVSNRSFKQDQLWFCSFFHPEIWAGRGFFPENSFLDTLYQAWNSLASSSTSTVASYRAVRMEQG